MVFLTARVYLVRTKVVFQNTTGHLGFVRKIVSIITNVADYVIYITALISLLVWVNILNFIWQIISQASVIALYL